MSFCVWSNLVQFLSKKEKKWCFYLICYNSYLYGQNSSLPESRLEVMHPFLSNYFDLSLNIHPTYLHKFIIYAVASRNSYTTAWVFPLSTNWIYSKASRCAVSIAITK